MSNSALVSSIGPFFTTFWSNENGSTKDEPFEGQYVPWWPKKIEEIRKTILRWIRLVIKKPTRFGVWLNFSIF